MTGFKSINDLVREVLEKHLPNGDTNALSKQLSRINTCWPKCTSELINQNVKPVRLDGNTLIVETHSSVWSNKMRYSCRSVLKALHTLGFKDINYIRVKINPRWSINLQNSVGPSKSM